MLLDIFSFSRLSHYVEILRLLKIQYLDELDGG